MIFTVPAPVDNKTFINAERVQFDFVRQGINAAVFSLMSFFCSEICQNREIKDGGWLKKHEGPHSNVYKLLLFRFFSKPKKVEKTKDLKRKTTEIKQCTLYKNGSRSLRVSSD